MENKTSKNILLIIMGVLILVSIALSLASAESQNIILTLSEIISLVFIALYGFWLYKKPHGNMLKCAMLLLASAQIIFAAKCLQSGYGIFCHLIVWLFAAAILVYVSGRLDRFEQNKYLLAIAATLQFLITFAAVFSTTGSVSLLRMLSWFSGAISTLTLMIAYFVRYKEHKEAGLMDAPKK